MATTPGGVTSGGVDMTVGRMRYQDDTARFWSSSDIRGTDGSFFTLNYRVQHDQLIYGPLQASFRLNGQGSQWQLWMRPQAPLGGPSAVRAYDVGTGAVDRGVVATAEVKATVPAVRLGWEANPLSRPGFL